MATHEHSTPPPVTPEPSDQERRLLPNYESKFDVPLTDSEFILNPGHYNYVKDSATAWIAEGFAREVKVTDAIRLVIDTERLITWIEASLHENFLEKFQSYLVLILTLLVSSAESAEKNDRWTALVKRVLDTFNPQQLSNRVDQVERTIQAIDEELRQPTLRTYEFFDAHENILLLIQGNLGQIEEGDTAGLILRIKSGEIDQKIMTLETAFKREFVNFGKSLEYFGHNLDLATNVLALFLAGLDETLWHKHPQILEPRMTLLESLNVLEDLVPDSAKTDTAYLETRQCLTLWQGILARVKAGTLESAEDITEELQMVERRLLEVQKLLG